jgi:hypothetical protein
MATRIAVLSANVACDAIVDRIDVGGAGHLKIYTGAQPATGDTAVSGTLLADFTLPATAFGSASSGTATAGAITTVTGAADGTAGYFRVTVAATTTPVIDGACGTSGTEMTMNTTTISTGVNVQITAYTVTMPTS